MWAGEPQGGYLERQEDPKISRWTMETKDNNRCHLEGVLMQHV